MTATPSFWAGYWQSLKSLDVEEPIDVYVHRPLAYLLARALLPTPVSPNLVTIASMLIGVSGAYLMVADVPYHWQWAALCTFTGTVFDCADGQLARMRKTSSVIGRMLDGTADVIVTAAILIAGGYHLYFKYGVTNAWLAEAAVDMSDRDRVSLRGETTGKTNDELVIASEAADEIHSIGKVQAGYARQLAAWRNWKMSAGATVGVAIVPAALAAAYGRRTPGEIAVFFAVKP